MCVYVGREGAWFEFLLPLLHSRFGRLEVWPGAVGSGFRDMEVVRAGPGVCGPFWLRKPKLALQRPVCACVGGGWG